MDVCARAPKLDVKIKIADRQVRSTVCPGQAFFVGLKYGCVMSVCCGRFYTGVPIRTERRRHLLQTKIPWAHALAELPLKIK
jgi:hypothetical protein